MVVFPNHSADGMRSKLTIKFMVQQARTYTIHQTFFYCNKESILCFSPIPSGLPLMWPCHYTVGVCISLFVGFAGTVALSLYCGCLHLSVCWLCRNCGPVIILWMSASLYLLVVQELWPCHYTVGVCISLFVGCAGTETRECNSEEGACRCKVSQLKLVETLK